MKRTFRAVFINVGHDSPDAVDKPRVFGRVFNDADLIAARLRGEPDLDGEIYTTRAARLSEATAQRMKKAKR